MAISESKNSLMFFTAEVKLVNLNICEQKKKNQKKKPNILKGRQSVRYGGYRQRA